jgi:hypothetical protein
MDLMEFDGISWTSMAFEWDLMGFFMEKPYK